MTTEIMKLTYETDFGNEGEDTDPINPLSRAVSRLFEDGQPFKRLNMCCFSDEAPAAVPRWFGVFIKSSWDRIIYFPGYMKTVEPIIGYRGNKLQWNQIFDLDHMTIENNFESWHITSRRSREHIGALPTAALGGGRFLWFGMSLSQSNIFRDFKNKTIVTTKIPVSDSNRRSQVFFDSRDGANFHILGINPDSRNIFPNGFFHFSLIVGPSGFELYKGEKHGYPVDSPFLGKPLPIGELNIPVRLHRVSLSENIDIQITIAWLPGALKKPIVLTAVK